MRTLYIFIINFKVFKAINKNFRVYYKLERKPVQMDGINKTLSNFYSNFYSIFDFNFYKYLINKYKIVIIIINNIYIYYY